MAGIFQPKACGLGSCLSFCRPRVGKPCRVPSGGRRAPPRTARPAAAIPASETQCCRASARSRDRLPAPRPSRFHPGEFFILWEMSVRLLTLDSAWVGAGGI